MARPLNALMLFEKSKAIISHPTRLFIQLVCLGLVAVSLPGFAQGPDAETCDLDGYDSSVRPDPPGTPTEITIGLVLSDLSGISDVDQTVTLDALLTLNWTDHRLDAARGCRYEFPAIWTPEIQLVNSGTIQPRQPPQLIVRANGSITTATRYNASIVSPAHISEFPFDQRSVSLQLGSVEYDADDLLFRISEQWTGRRQEMSIPDWDIGEPSAEIRQLTLPRVDRTVAVFDFQIPATRLADYYIYKFAFPLCLIVMMSWSVFWIDPRTLGPQLSLAATSMLTLIAYQFTVNELLPRVGYLTKMDQYVLSSSFLVFLALVEALVSGGLASSGRAVTAEKLDRVSRWLFPATYIAVIFVTLVL